MKVRATNADHVVYPQGGRKKGFTDGLNHFAYFSLFSGAKRDLRVTVRFALTLMSALRRRLIAASSPPAATREALTTAAATVVTAEMEKLAKTLMNAR